MTNEEILQKAIEKAKKNGWQTKWISLNPGYENIALFNQGFAKAFFGEEAHSPKVIPMKVTLEYRDPYTTPSEPIGYWTMWQYHLKQMVLSEDPIRYLESYL